MLLQNIVQSKKKRTRRVRQIQSELQILKEAIKEGVVNFTRGCITKALETMEKNTEIILKKFEIKLKEMVPVAVEVETKIGIPKTIEYLAELN